jgi:hypothetical protein
MVRHLRRTIAAVFGASLFLGCAVASADEPAAAPAQVPVEEKKKGTDTKIIPLPIYATLPNEGNTFGFMPVFLVVDAESRRTISIIAPSGSWNSVIGVTGTMRWFHYPDLPRALALRASVSQRVNWSGTLTWNNRPREPGRWTDDVLLRVERSVFFRFFGLGPDTVDSSETSHTRLRGQLELRRGLNLGSNFNVGARAAVLGDNTNRRSVPDLPASQDVFPDVPGMKGAAVMGGGIDVRYDSRPQYEFSRTGFYSIWSVRYFYGLEKSPNFARFEFETRGLLEELDWLHLSARLYASYVSARNAPFYYQSSLGGSYLMRGFTEDRFIDRGAWTIEVEQRVRLFKTHIFGVDAEWRVDPFVAIGQVFSDRDTIVSHVRVAEGVGLRAFVPPTVLGRVDLAFAGEGLKVYVELGYPF